MNYLVLIVLSIILVGISILGIGIKILVKKNGEFKKQCSSVDPGTGKKIGCTCSDNDKANCKNKTN